MAEINKSSKFYHYQSAMNSTNESSQAGNLPERFAQHPKFQYDKADYTTFKKNYTSSSNWFSQKVMALPKSAWSGNVKTVYHLAKAIYITAKTANDFGLNKAQKNYIFAQYYFVARDFQEAFGGLTSFFHKSFGQYQVQESYFHKNAYDTYSKFFIDPETSPSENVLKATYSPKRQAADLSRAYLRRGWLEKAYATMLSTPLCNTNKDKAKDKAELYYDVLLAAVLKGEEALADSVSTNLVSFSPTERIHDSIKTYASDGNIDILKNIIRPDQSHYDTWSYPLAHSAIEELVSNDNLDMATELISEIPFSPSQKLFLNAKLIPGFIKNENLDQAFEAFGNLNTMRNLTTRENHLSVVMSNGEKYDRRVAIDTAFELLIDACIKQGDITRIINITLPDTPEVLVRKICDE